MGRAILAMSGSAVSLLPRPFVVFRDLVVDLWREMTRDVIRPYRPELHYMRGPGPAWRAKHGLPRWAETPFHFAVPCPKVARPGPSRVQRKGFAWFGQLFSTTIKTWRWLSPTGLGSPRTSRSRCSISLSPARTKRSRPCRASRSSSACASAPPSRAKLIEALPDLKLLITTGARNNSFDVKACRRARHHCLRHRRYRVVRPPALLSA